mmetsp:Transcript_26061/g.82725  ORF Transcript_26061/g.82725 Transcript_26061/m.82725 type:complete len:206 (+) Transcript_26061:367-984(+)
MTTYRLMRVSPLSQLERPEGSAVATPRMVRTRQAVELEGDQARVGEEEHEGDPAREREHVALRVLVPRRLCLAEDVRNNHSHGAQDQDCSVRLCALLVVALRGVPYAPKEEGAAEHEQQVGEDGAEQRHLHDAQHATLECKEGDDDLGHVAKGCVQQAAQRLRCVQRQLLRHVAQTLCERRDCNERKEEDSAGVPVVLLCKDRQR